ncbi:MAG: sulfite exporter TauE/SafE family protein [Eubacteriales bacterium]
MGTNFITETYSVRGMACTGCETIIHNVLLRTDGVKEVEADFAGNSVKITFDADKVSLVKLQQILKKEGYSLDTGSPAGIKDAHPSGSQQTTGHREKTFSPLQFAGLVIALLAGYLIIKNTVGFTFIPEITASMGYGMLFVIGLLTSIHCVAMCGGINLSQCMPKGEAPAAAKDKIRPSLLYNLGRVTSYTIIGGIVGALGSVFSFSGRAKGAIAILAGIFMVVMGISMLGIFPWLNKFTPRLPRFLRRKAGAAGKGKGPFIVGLLNGLMPCGPLQAMQIYALGTGSFLTGALSMFFFSLGTLPLMFGLGVFIMFLGSKFSKWMVGIGAVLVVVLGIIMFTRGAALAGIGMPRLVWGSAAQASTAQASETLTDKAAANVNPSVSSGSSSDTQNVQYITSTLTANGYPDITVQKGVPVEWTIHADKGVINGCNGTMELNAYGLEVKLKEGDNLIKFTPTESGTITYSCWMGMITGQITVGDKAAGSSGQVQTDATSAAGNAVTPVPSQRLAAGGCCGV